MEFLVDIKNMMMPEVIVSFGILALCLLSLFYKKAKQSAYTIAISFLIFAFGALLLIDGNSACTAFYGAFLSNKFTVFFKELIIAGSIFTVLMSDRYIKTLKKSASEFYALLFTATLGAMILVSSKDFITLFIGLETLGISSYILSGFLKKQKSSSMTAFKFLITGALASTVMLYGASFLYGISATLDFDSIKTALANPNTAYIGILGAVLVVCGLCFKIAAVPFYNWAADVYQGSPLSVSAFLSVVSKIAGFGILIRILSEIFSAVWIINILVLLISAITMSLGNFLAIRENNIKRLMAYSSIAHSGYILASLALGSTFGISAAVFYIITYLFMNFALWGCIETIDKTPNTMIDNFKGLAYKNPYLSAAMVVSLVSLAGLPVTVGFFSKFYLFQTISFAGFAIFPFLFVVLFNSLISLFYYFKVIRVLFEGADFDMKLVLSKRLRAMIFITVLFTAIAGIFSAPIIQYSQQVAQAQMPTIIDYDQLEDGFINSY